MQQLAGECCTEVYGTWPHMVMFCSTFVVSQTIVPKQTGLLYWAKELDSLVMYVCNPCEVYVRSQRGQLYTYHLTAGNVMQSAKQSVLQIPLLWLHESCYPYLYIVAPESLCLLCTHMDVTRCIVCTHSPWHTIQCHHSSDGCCRQLCRNYHVLLVQRNSHPFPHSIWFFATYDMHVTVNDEWFFAYHCGGLMTSYGSCGTCNIEYEALDLCGFTLKLWHL